LARRAEAERCFRRARDIYKATVGEKHPNYATTLNNLASLCQTQAGLQEQRENFTEAEAARLEVLRCKTELYGRGGWRVTDRRLGLEDTRLLARLDVKQRQRLRQADQWNRQVFRLWQQGKSNEALPLAEKALAASRMILGESHRHTAMSWFNLGAQHKAL